MATTHSKEMTIYYCGHLKAILKELADGKKVYTHHFEHINPKVWQFVGKENRPHLRKCLKTLEAAGLIENFNLGFNIHQWAITDSGQALIISGKDIVNEITSPSHGV